MNLSFDHPWIVPVGLGVLALNVVCLGVLLALRPAVRQAYERGANELAALCRAFMAEVLGTFALVFVGVLAGIAGPLAGGDPPGLVGVALAHGLVITICLAALARFSGGHFNPAVTVGFLCTGRLHFLAAIGYVLAQLGGAIGAAFLLACLFGPHALVGAVPSVNPNLTPQAALVLEAIATFVLVLVIFGTAVDERGPHVLAPATIGSSVTVGILAIGSLTGGALNPARYLGPALLCQHLDGWVVYTAGPAAGGAIAAVLMQFFLLEESGTPTVPAPGPEEEPLAEIEDEPRQAA